MERDRDIGLKSRCIDVKFSCMSVIDTSDG